MGFEEVCWYQRSHVILVNLYLLREQKLEAERQRILEEEMRDCSFVPRSHKQQQIAQTRLSDAPPPPPLPLPPPISEKQSISSGRVPLPDAIPMPTIGRPNAYHYEASPNEMGRVPLPVSRSVPEKFSGSGRVPLPSGKSSGVPLVLRELEGDEDEDDQLVLSRGNVSFSDNYNRSVPVIQDERSGGLAFGQQQPSRLFATGQQFDGTELDCLELEEDEGWGNTILHSNVLFDPNPVYARQHRAPPPIPLPAKSLR